jgi:hypothetical protein
MTSLPKDSDNNTIPALRLRAGGSHAIAVTATSARNAAPFTSFCRVVSLYATGPIFLRFGNSSVTATTSDHYFPGGVYYDMAIQGSKTSQNTYVAAVRAEGDCTLYVSEKE